MLTAAVLKAQAAELVPSHLCEDRHQASRAIYFAQDRIRLSRQIAEKQKIESEYGLNRVRLIQHEEANTEYGIGSRGSVRVGTGF